MAPAGDRRGRLVLVIHRRPWLEPSLEAALRRRYDLRLRVVLRRPILSVRAGWIASMASKRRLVVGDVLLFLRLLASPSLYARRLQFLCTGGHIGVLMFARALRPLRLHHRTYLLNFYLHQLGEHPLVKRALKMLLTRDVFVLAQTSADAAYFHQFLPAENVVVIPYSQWDEFPDGSALHQADYVFSGGWTNRDYDTLFRCARRLPSVRFVVVASQRSPISEVQPENVTLLRDLPLAEFHRLLAESRVVAIPLLDDVGSSGQRVLLAAMAASKPVVVPRLGATIDHVRDDVTGVLYEPGDEESLASAIARLWRDREGARAMGVAARDEFLERFTPERYSEQVLEFLEATSEP